MKLSSRLQTIADLIDKNDFPADVGCDHAYLSIYLANNIIDKVVATEIAQGPYDTAKGNILNANLIDKIVLYKTDGLNNVDENINTIIISGMGAHTITHILKNYNNISRISKIIIQSNNDLELIRKHMYKIGFYIEKEYYTFDKKHDYITMLFKKGKKTISANELKFGIYNKSLKDYYKKLIIKYESLLNKINDTQRIEKIRNDITYLENTINDSN